jgi:rubredoxin-NAD+ reductase
MTDRIVIVGAGLGGVTLAKELRKVDADRAITILTQDSDEIYSKPMLSNALAKGRTADALVASSPEKFATQLNIDMRCKTRVLGVDPQQHRVIFSEAGSSETQTESYSQLILATGARPSPMTLNGTASDQLLRVNHLRDYALFREQIAGKRHIAVLGGELVGCEFANDLLAGGYEVSIVSTGRTLLDGLAPPELGDRLAQSFEREGIHVRFNGRAIAIDRAAPDANHDLRLSCETGAPIDCDAVLAATGLLPNVMLARQAGLNVEHGVLTDACCQTSDPDIYALGDCAQINGICRMYVLPIMHSAKALAKTLCGDRTPVNFPPMPVAVKTPACTMTLCPPAVREQTQWSVEQADANSIKALSHDMSGSLNGFAVCGRFLSESRALTDQLQARALTNVTTFSATRT